MTISNLLKVKEDGHLLVGWPSHACSKAMRMALYHPLKGKEDDQLQSIEGEGGGPSPIDLKDTKAYHLPSSSN